MNRPRLLTMATLDDLRLPILDQLTIPVFYNVADEQVPHTVNDLLAPFDLADFGEEGCEINNLLYPMKTSAQMHLCPSIELMQQHWTPFDESSEEDTAVHFVIVDRFLFQYFLDTASRFQNVIHLGGLPGQRFSHQTRLEVHLLPSTEAIEMVSRIHGECCRLRAEVVGLRRHVQRTEQRLGNLIETLGAAWPHLAEDLGLTLQMSDFDPTPGDP